MYRNPGVFDRPAPSPYSLYTGGNRKTDDLAIYYNVACDNLKMERKQIADWPRERQMSHLAEFLWKAHKKKKNATGYQLTVEDERAINLLEEKVNKIRNYQSHIWHSNEVLVFEPELMEFVMKKYEEACAEIFALMPDAYLDLETLLNKPAYRKFSFFSKIPGTETYCITDEGRIFFLSFFLTSGQMSQLLQQRKGSKRADLPLFKVKREIYTYYCHRDGAAIMDFNQEDQVLTRLGKEEKREVLHARTAYKLVNYLFDYPHYWAQSSFMPLLLPDGSHIKDIYQLKDFLQQRPDLLPGLELKLIARKKPSSQDRDTKEYEKLLKEEEDAWRAGTISFTCTEIPGFTFYIVFDTLYRLALLQLLHVQANGEDSPAKLLKANLQKEAENRRKWYSILQKLPSEREKEDWNYILGKQNQYLRGTTWLTQLGITFIENMEKGNEEKERVSARLCAMIRPGEQPVELPGIAPEPIMVYQQDFVAGTTKKFRTGNLFMFYATRYLVDFCGDNWYWGVEKFEMKKGSGKSNKESLVKVKDYMLASEIERAGDRRITLENDHVYVAIQQAEATGPNHKRFVQFAIGPLAMRYLMAEAMADKDNFPARMKGFLSKLNADVNKLKEQGGWKEDTMYKLLEKQFIAGYLVPGNHTADNLRTSIKTRIKNIFEKWDHAVKNKHTLSRAEKNRIILQAYRFFKWPKGDNGHPRFLRASEYNGMSVCHFSLRVKDKEITRYNSFGRPMKGKLDYLFRDVFELSTRKPQIPQKIVNLLYEAKSLDGLLDSVIDSAREILQKDYRTTEGLPSQVAKKALAELARSLGISVRPELLRESEKDELKKKHADTLQVQIFPIHPMLVVKNFFPGHYQPEGFQVKKNKNGAEVKTRAAIPVFADLRNTSLFRNKVYAPFYDATLAERLFPETAGVQRKKLVGEMNTVCTEDILLWQVAHAYMEQNAYTQTLARYISDTPIENRSLDQLLKMDAKLHFSNVDGSGIYVNIQFHRLDDLIYRSEHGNLQLAAKHFLRRCTEEFDYWQNQLEQVQTVQLSGAPLPDGSEERPIPFQVLIDEIELVRRTGKKFAAHILNFERAIYNHLLSLRGNENSLQSYLLQLFGQHNGNELPHINFNIVLQLAQENGFAVPDDVKQLLTYYRNKAFHNNIPDGNSLCYVTREGQPLRTLLNITENLDAKKDRSRYLTESDELSAEMEN